MIGSHIRLLFALIFAVVFFSSATFSQNQVNADKYKPRTLAEVVDLNRVGTDPILKKAKLEERQGFIGIDPYFSKAKVQFLGKSRPLSSEHSGLISNWKKLQRVDKKFVSLYENEYLFKEVDIEYWIPLQKEMAISLEQNVKSGETVALFVIYVGAEKESNVSQFSSLFLATAFEK